MMLLKAVREIMFFKCQQLSIFNHQEIFQNFLKSCLVFMSFAAWSLAILPCHLQSEIVEFCCIKRISWEQSFYFLIIRQFFNNLAKLLYIYIYFFYIWYGWCGNFQSSLRIFTEFFKAQFFVVDFAARFIYTFARNVKFKFGCTFSKKKSPVKDQSFHCE